MEKHWIIGLQFPNILITQFDEVVEYASKVGGEHRKELEI